MPDWQNIFAALREDAISVADNASPRPVGGGDISAAWRIDTDDAAVFVKPGPGIHSICSRQRQRGFVSSAQ